MALLNGLDEFDSKAQPGDWAFLNQDTYIAVKLTNAEDGVCVIPIGSEQTDHNWKWDGNHESPTLIPSILHHSSPPWHGYLTEGKLVPV